MVVDMTDSESENDDNSQVWEEVHSEEEFWNALTQITNPSTEPNTYEAIDDALRSYLDVSIKYKNAYLCEEYDVGQCCYVLLSSSLFAGYTDYVRRQVLYGLLQEDAAGLLYIFASILLIDGRENETVFQMMNEEGAFARLLELVSDRDGSRKRQQQEFEADRASDDDNNGDVVEWASLHRLLLVLMYEMSRMQRIRNDELLLVEDDFVIELFKIIEELSDDVNDPYHYPVIRILLVLNEQFMVAAHEPGHATHPLPITNKVIKILATHGALYKTFGENIILVLNRESETSLQLLTLKLLYLLFTTPTTQEYFYTNDLRVLVDILIRNLLDLPEEALALRHTYLRVLYPLLAHTQLRFPPHYKRDEIRKLLGVLVRGYAPGYDDAIRHFECADETTQRLVNRCSTVDWIQDADATAAQAAEAVKDEGDGNTAPGDRRASTASSHAGDSPISPIKRIIPKLLGMSLAPARESSLSVLEVAAHTEKPGVMTPSRKTAKQKPEPPKARRRGRKQAGLEDVEAAARLAAAGENSTAAAVAAAGEAATSVLTMSTIMGEPVISETKTAEPMPETSPELSRVELLARAHPVRSTSLASTASNSTTNGVPLPPNPPTSAPRNIKPPEPPKTRRWRAKPPPAPPPERRKKSEAGDVKAASQDEWDGDKNGLGNGATEV